MSSSNRSALVTGASDGLGATIATRIATQGFHVFVHGRNANRGDAVVSAIRSSGGSAEFVGGDLLSPQTIGEICDHCLDKRTRIDVLVNNAGGGGEHQTWWQTTPEKWRWSFDLNVFSAAEFCRRLVPHMQTAGWGRVVNICSIAAIRPLSIGPEYAAAKAALNSITVSLAKACERSGVTCNSISPGLLAHSAIAHGIAKLDENSQGVMSDAFATLTGRLPTKEEIAGIVSFLASDDAASVSGENIVADGGYQHITPTF